MTMLSPYFFFYFRNSLANHPDKMYDIAFKTIPIAIRYCVIFQRRSNLLVMVSSFSSSCFLSSSGMVIVRARSFGIREDRNDVELDFSLFRFRVLIYLGASRSGPRRCEDRASSFIFIFLLSKCNSVSYHRDCLVFIVFVCHRAPSESNCQHMLLSS